MIRLFLVSFVCFLYGSVFYYFCFYFDMCLLSVEEAFGFCGGLLGYVSLADSDN